MTATLVQVVRPGWSPLADLNNVALKRYIAAKYNIFKEQIGKRAVGRSLPSSPVERIIRWLSIIASSSNR